MSGVPKTIVLRAMLAPHSKQARVLTAAVLARYLDLGEESDIPSLAADCGRSRAWVRKHTPDMTHDARVLARSSRGHYENSARTWQPSAALLRRIILNTNCE